MLRDIATPMSPSTRSATTPLRKLVGLVSTLLLPLAFLGQIVTLARAATQADIIGTWSTGHAAVLTGPVSRPSKSPQGGTGAFRSAVITWHDWEKAVERHRWGWKELYRAIRDLVAGVNRPR